MNLARIHYTKLVAVFRTYNWTRGHLEKLRLLKNFFLFPQNAWQFMSANELVVVTLMRLSDAYVKEETADFCHSEMESGENNSSENKQDEADHSSASSCKRVFFD